MLIKAISDTHNDHGQLDLGSGDILIHCGDACTKGNYSEAEAFLWWLTKQPFKYKIIVPGNHDKKLATHPDIQMLIHNLGIIYLHDTYVTIEGILIYGNGYTTSTERDTGAYREQHPLSRRTAAWKNFKQKPDILITHNAPWGILDTNLEGQHIGDDILLKKVNEIRPKYHLFGHIHEHGGKTLSLWGTEFINVACKSREYLMVRGAKEIIYE